MLLPVKNSQEKSKSMRTCLSLLGLGLRRSILSMPCFFSVLGVGMVMFFTSYNMATDTSDVLYLIDLGKTGNLPLILCIAPTIPFGLSFASEWQERSLKFWLIRSGLKKYVWCKAAVCFISGILVVFAGILTYAIVLSTHYPFFLFISSGDAYTVLLESGKPLHFFLLSSFHYALSGGMFSVAALCVSGFVPTRFTSLAAPMVLYMVFLRVSMFFSLPLFLHPDYLTEVTYGIGTPLVTFFFKFFLIIAICSLLGLILQIRVKRLVQNA